MLQMEQNWMVVRTFNRHEMTVSDFLKQEGVTCFIPMRYVEKQVRDEPKPRRILMPVIHNYVFVRLEMPVVQFSSLLAKCATPLYILKHKDTDRPVEITNREMVEFRMLCDPAFEQRVSIVQQGDEPEVGREVEIIHGPFAGVHGRLYRKQKKYWFVKTIAGISVELRITRWFCKPV
jgi:transcription antitermination factor NusG